MSLLIAVIVLSCLCAAPTLCAPPDLHPNILFILADDLGYADIGYHGGGGQIKTLVLDSLASEGVKLENYYVQPMCTPSRSTLMTGRLPIHIGLQHFVIPNGFPYGMPLDLPTLPEKLKTAGYDTHMVGKWHLGMYKEEYLPVNRGFDTFYGLYNGDKDYFTHIACSRQGADVCGLDLHNGTTPDRSKNGTYATHLFTDEAIRLIKLQKKKSSPMFMYLAYQSVHAPQQVPEQYELPYQSIKNKRRRVMAAQMSVMDEGIGNVTLALKDAGLWNNTIIIFSSDNGGMVPAQNDVGCNYPLRGGKKTVWEGGVRVAGFVTGPLVSNPGSINKDLIHISDWYPTILGLAGVSTNNITLDGFDQWPAITGSGESERTEILYNIDPLQPLYGERKTNSSFDNRQQAALRVGDYKILTGTQLLSGWYKPVSIEGEVEQAVVDEKLKKQRAQEIQDKSLLQNVFLFNITADPYERNDLSKEKPDVVAAMLSRLEEYAKASVPPPNVTAQLELADPKKHDGSWEPWQNKAFSISNNSVNAEVSSTYLWYCFTVCSLFTNLL